MAAILKRSEDNEQLNHVRQEIELEIPVPEVVQHPEGADGSEEREMETTEATSSDPTVNEEGEGAQREDGQAMSLMEAPTMPSMHICFLYVFATASHSSRLGKEE